MAHYSDMFLQELVRAGTIDEAQAAEVAPSDADGDRKFDRLAQQLLMSLQAQPAEGTEEESAGVVDIADAKGIA